MPGFCPGYIAEESEAESSQHCQHAGSVAAKKYGERAEKRAWQAGSASLSSRPDHRQADNRRCSGGV